MKPFPFRSWSDWFWLGILVTGGILSPYVFPDNPYAGPEFRKLAVTLWWVFGAVFGVVCLLAADNRRAEQINARMSELLAEAGALQTAGRWKEADDALRQYEAIAVMLTCPRCGTCLHFPPYVIPRTKRRCPTCRVPMVVARPSQTSKGRETGG
jgi:hypothetical protein